jgi:phosphate:Na+ symporter
VLFKIIAALIAVAAFPFTAAMMRALAASVDGMTLLAAYHTAYNVVGVAVLLPAAQWFTRVVERLLPSRQTPLQRALDPSALASPVVAVEAARRVVAEVLTTTAASVAAALPGRPGPAGRDTAAATLAEVRDFLSGLQEPPETEAERQRLTSTLHALDHASRLAQIVTDGAPAEQPAAGLCAAAMRAVQTIGGSITSEAAFSIQATPIGWHVSPEVAAALAEAESMAKELDGLRRSHRATTIAAVAPGKLTAAEAFARIDAARQLDRITHHAWRSAAHLLGLGTPESAPAPPL